MGAAGLRGNFFQSLTNDFGVRFEGHRLNASAEEFFGTDAQDFLKYRVDELNGSIASQNRNQLLRRIQQDRKLLRPQSQTSL